MDHELRYRPGFTGLAHLGIPNNTRPHWYCTCGQWRINRDHKGSPFEKTATTHHRRHVKQTGEQ